MKIEKNYFGRSGDGKAVDIYTLTNNQGMTARITNFGGILVSLLVPDKQGRIADVVLGFDRLEDYLADDKFFGATVGRYANRIANAHFLLDGIEYRLAKNDGNNNLHGGPGGYHKVLWNAEPFSGPEGVELRLSYLSRDMEEGFPGNLSCRVIYKLSQSNEFIIEYEAETDKATPVNLTHHSYFNLAGAGEGPILDHVLTINADHYTPVGFHHIVTGEISAVADTTLDFREPKRIGEQLHLIPGGYDHNFVLNEDAGSLAPAARVVEPKSGRIMEVRTSKPGMQFYSGNFLNDSVVGKSGKLYGQHTGFCLETQYFPDSPNQTGFPSSILRPGEKYSQKTAYSFGIE